jgi:zinc and cadmium transporter
MSPPVSVAFYSVVIVAGSLLGALVPLFTRREKWQVGFLAFAAGVMFGAAFFDMLPEAFRTGGYAVFSWLPLGFALMFLLERYVLAHACEEPPEFATHAHGPMGLTAFLGLSAHTLFDGLALGSSAAEQIGLTAFVAIVAHKIPASLSLATILRSEGRSRTRVLVLAGVFGLMVPLGALIYFGLDRVLPYAGFAPRALAFSAGTFLYIAVSDLLPHVNRHKHHGRAGHVAAFLVGLFVMFGLGLVTRE